MDIEKLNLKQKILQMFICGFNGKNFSANEYFTEMLQEGLGGVIFFTHNIESEKQFKDLISDLAYNAKIPMLYSIDQEGGRVERTENIYKGKKYLSAKNAYQMGLSYLQNQTKEIALELKNYGINMNFAPVLDVNTNNENPIIGERAFSSNTEEVINAGKIVFKEYEKYGIISVGKHFPGHGASSEDSHLTLPSINLSEDELKNIHIKPFAELIKEEIPVIMAAHVLYPSLDNSLVPASVSKKIINDILINELNFKGVIVTDDMEMNGIKSYSRIEACIKAVNAGVNMFIFRNTTKEIYMLVQNMEAAVKKGEINEQNINLSVKKILELKYRYGIIQKMN